MLQIVEFKRSFLFRHIYILIYLNEWIMNIRADKSFFNIFSIFSIFPGKKKMWTVQLYFYINNCNFFFSDSITSNSATFSGEQNLFSWFINKNNKYNQYNKNVHRVYSRWFSIELPRKHRIWMLCHYKQKNVINTN